MTSIWVKICLLGERAEADLLTHLMRSLFQASIYLILQWLIAHWHKVLEIVDPSVTALFHFHVDVLKFRKPLCIHQSSHLPLLVTAEPSLAFDQRSSKWFPAFWIKKVRPKSQNNWPVMLRVDFTLIWALIRPFEQRSKHFDGNRGFLWEPWANPHWEAEEAGPTCPPHSHCSGSTREARLAQHGFAVPAPECLGAVSDSRARRASRRTLLGKRPVV